MWKWCNSKTRSLALIAGVIVSAVILNLLYCSRDSCDQHTSISLTPDRWFDNGSVKAVDGTIYTSGQYISDDDGHFRACVCSVKPCVRKCCPSGDLLMRTGTPGLKCNNSPETQQYNARFMVQFYDGTIPLASVESYGIISEHNHPCPKQSGKFPLYKESIYLQKDGILYIPEYPLGKRIIKMPNYCADLVLENKDTVPTMKMFSCIDPIDDLEEKCSLKIRATGMLISVPFLLATFLVYAIIPELRNLHGKSLMCHVFSMMVAYVFLAIVQIANSSLSPAACVSFAFIVLFSFLVTFFWLNVMCFDIWWTFSGFRGFRGSIRDAEHKKFLVYSLYAWGCPTILLIASLIMQFHPSIPDHWIRPRFGIGKCWFSDPTSTIIYFYGPMLVLVVCNIFLFIITAFKIRKIKRETSVLKRQDSQRHNYENDKQRFNLYLKLFVVMGINWAMELISWWLQEIKALEWFFRVTDVANTLQGILIFVIFVCKRQIWKLLVKRYHSLMGQPMKGHSSMTRTQTTSYSSSQDPTVISRSGNGMQMRTLSAADDKN